MASHFNLVAVRKKILIDLNCRHIVIGCLKTDGREIDLLEVAATRLLSITVHCQQPRQQWHRDDMVGTASARLCSL